MTRILALISRGIMLAGLWLAALISVFPFYWMVVGATNTAVDVTGGKVTFGYALGDNIAKFFELVDVPRVFFNSAFVAIVGTILTLIVSSLAGYGFEIFRSRARDRIFGGLLIMLSVLLPTNQHLLGMSRGQNLLMSCFSFY